MKTDKVRQVAIIAKSDEQKSALAFRKSQQHHRQNCDQLDQLITYKREYETNLGTLGDQGIAARQLQDYRLFLRKLDQAIESQAETVQHALKDVDLAREQWLSRARHKSSLDTLLDRRRSEWVQAAEKAEQKESDESSLARRFNIDEI